MKPTRPLTFAPTLLLCIQESKQQQQQEQYSRLICVMCFIYKAHYRSFSLARAREELARSPLFFLPFCVCTRVKKCKYLGIFSVWEG